MPDRIETIRAMLDKNPDDVFLRYSLGMEYASAGRLDQATAEFARCMELDSQYLPAYVEAGKALRSAGKIAEAGEVFRKGLELAARLGQAHAQDNLRQQLEGLPRS
jgi:tetratricopeptide (TPR) repeat protein